MALLRASLQVLAAFSIVLILFVLAYYVFNREALRAIRQSGKLTSRIDIFKGIKDMSITNETYDTVNDNGGMYMDLKPSVNQSGGIEFAYNFWLYQKDNYQPRSTDNSIAVPVDAGLTTNDVVLLLRGINRVQNYTNVCGVQKPNVYVKCPLIKLENNGNSLTVEFNTEKSVDPVREGAKNVCNQTIRNWDEANQHKVSIRGLKTNNAFLNKWFMVTVILQDTYPSDPLPFRNRVRVRIYINGVLELDQYVENSIGQNDEPTILKPNEGNLYIMPQITISGNDKSAKPATSAINNIMMADLSYFNYAVDSDSVLTMYQNGFNQYYATSPKGSNPLDNLLAISQNDKRGGELRSTSESVY